MAIIGQLLLWALKAFYWVIIIQVVLSWLIAFEVINVRNQKAQQVIALLNKITDPIYRPLRKFIPSIGGIDVTPIIVILAIFVLQSVIVKIFFGL